MIFLCNMYALDFFAATASAAATSTFSTLGEIVWVQPFEMSLQITDSGS